MTPGCSGREEEKNKFELWTSIEGPDKGWNKKTDEREEGKM